MLSWNKVFGCVLSFLFSWDKLSILKNIVTLVGGQASLTLQGCNLKPKCPTNNGAENPRTQTLVLPSSLRLLLRWPGEARSCQHPREELGVLGGGVTCIPLHPHLPPISISSSRGDQRAESRRWGQRASFLPHWTLKHLKQQIRLLT